MTHQFKNLFVLFILLASVSGFAQNLITNGDFESGGVGTGFQTNYFLVSSNSGPRNYAIVSDPSTINSNFSNACTDHSSTGNKMMVVDGATSGANSDKIWEALTSTGGGGGIPVISGTTYTFSYWIQSISNTNTVANSANIQVKINNVDVSPTTGSSICPVTLCGWTQVTYTWVATSGFAQIWLFDRQTSSAGNDFALDDISLTAAPSPLSLTYSITNPTCPTNTNATLFGYGIGGTPPYTNYALSGPVNIPTSANGQFTGLAPGTYSITVTDSNGGTQTQNGIAIPNAPDMNLSATQTTICAGGSTTITASGGMTTYNWSSDIADPTMAATGSPQTVSPTQTTTYTVTSTSVRSENLIYNGDFFLGNVGFTSDYTYYATNTALVQKAYGVVANSNTWESAFASCSEHTGSAGSKMLVVDGSTSNAGNDAFWCQTIPVTPGQNYTLTYYLQALATPANASIQVKINGVVVGTNASTSGTTCTWTQPSINWNSGANNTARICFYDLTTTAAGNDFAIDDITFSRTNSCNLSKTITITVTNSLVLNIVNPAAVCAPGSVDITSPTVIGAGSTTGTTFTYWTNAAGTNAMTLAAAQNITTSGTYYIKSTLGGCSVIKPVTVTITTGSVPPPTVTSPIYFCNGSTATPLTATALAGATLNWYGTNATGGTASSTAPIPSTAVDGATTYYVSQTVGTCESPRIAIVVRINSISGAINIFCGATTTPNAVLFDWNNIGNRPDLYNYSYTINGGPAVTGSTTLSSLEVTGVLPGQSCTLTLISAIGYPCVTFPLEKTCPNCAATTNPTFTLPSSICSDIMPPPALPTTSDNGIVGTWNPATINNTANTTYTFTPNYTITPCANTYTKTINVANPPSAGSLSGNQTICVGTTTNFVPTVTGGTWSSANAAIATVNSTTGLITGVSSGTVNINYTVAGTGGCSSVTASRSITVTNPAIAGTLSGNQNICVSNTTTFIPTVTGGTWSSSNTAVATVNNLGVITGVSAGNSTITYNIAGTGGCPNATVTRTVSVSAIPSAGTLSGTQSICIGLSSNFSSTVTGGTWSSNNTAVATVNASGVVIGVTAGTAIITYTVAGVNGCANGTATRNVIVSANPSPGILYGNQTICQGTITTFTSSVSGGTWSSSNPTVATIDANTGIIGGVSAGNVTMTYTVTGTGGCNNVTATRTLTVNPNIVPTFNIISSVCEGGTIPAFPTRSINGITGTWDFAPNNMSTTTYTFTPTAGQCAVIAQHTITIDIPVTPLFDLVQPVCLGATPPVLPTSSNNTPPITGTWSPATVSTATVGQTICTFIPDPGQCVVTTAPTRLIVGVLSIDTPDFPPLSPICEGDIAPVLGNTSPNGITGTWSPATVSNTVDQSYTFTPTPGLCANTQTLSMTLIRKINPDFAAIPAFCKDTPAPALSTVSPNGISGTWQPSTTIDNTVSGDFDYVFTPDGTQCANPQTLTVTITEPTVPDFSDFGVCVGSTPPLLSPISNNGITGTWNPAIVDNILSGSYEFTPDAGQCATNKFINVTINQYTLNSIEGFVTNYFEENQIVTILATDAGNYLYQLDYGPLQEENVFQNVSPGIHTIKVIDANGCSSPISDEILVVNYPKFFTPNDDNYNDTWNIDGLSDQEGCLISIFDRYGKLLKQISPKGKGWDGTYNGERMPGTDYWFTVEYTEKGARKTFKSHFSLKR